MTTAIVRDQLASTLFADLFDEPLDTLARGRSPGPARHPRARVYRRRGDQDGRPVGEGRGLPRQLHHTTATRVDVLEVSCRSCRRPYEDVAGRECEALIDNRHLIGEDQTVRAKRKIPTPPPNAKVIPGGTIQRRGISAYVSGVSRPAR